ncbi:MAG: response regulator transcription factor [Acidimicrobiales bacterium]|nr:response regulator transcription factor [Acidimicrobiales bacterium]
MKVLLVDDHPMVRMGIKAGLESTFEEGVEITEVGSVDEAIAALDDAVFDIAVLDLRLGEGSGLDVARHISENNLSARCVVFTSVKSPRSLIAAFESGSVSAYLEKDSDLKPLAEAMEATAKGFSMLTHADARDAAAELGSQGALDRDSLTKRELEIAELIADGLSDAEISEALHLASSTVRNNLTTIYQKVGVESRTLLAGLVWESRKDLDIL